MKKRRLGQTGFHISVIGFGGIPIQKVDSATALTLIDMAHQQGINFIDTATGYGKSESLIGEAIEANGRSRWIIATKCPIRDYEGMKKAINASLEKLRTECIDLYQLHNVRTEEDYQKVMGEQGALRALKEAKEEGKIREIGITSHDLHILEKAIETNEFSTIQFPYNPVERQAEKLFERAKALDIGVIVMKPVAGGAISHVDLSLRFILENNNVTTVIPGMNEVEHIKQNSAVGNNPRPLTDDERQRIMGEASTLGTEFCRRCGYCAPCPQNIDIPTQFVLEGYLVRYGLKDWAQERYSGLPVQADACVECGACEPKCPYDLPIRQMLKRVHNNFNIVV